MFVRIHQRSAGGGSTGDPPNQRVALSLQHFCGGMERCHHRNAMQQDPHRTESAAETRFRGRTGLFGSSSGHLACIVAGRLDSTAGVHDFSSGRHCAVVPVG